MEEHGNDLTTDMKQALWEFATKDFPIYSQGMTNMPRQPWADVEEHIKTVLGNEPAKAKKKKSVVRHFIRQQSIRTIEWLDEHGYCQDHIRPDTSTIPQTGRGAFAARDLPAGIVVGYCPLVHMGEHGREVLDIEYEDGMGGVETPDGKSRHQYDLIINYSFGHGNSSVLLTPYGGMVNYINHAPSKERVPGAEPTANVKVRWPNKELIAHKPWWLEKDTAFLRDTTEKIGLSFEYIALRDIKEGEEVFMVSD